MLHHLTLALVLSAVFLCVLSLTTMYDCSSLTCAMSSDSWRTGECQQFIMRRMHRSRLCRDWVIHTLLLQWVLWRLGLGNIDDTVDIEGDLLRVRSPVFVAEAVGIPAVRSGSEGVITGGRAALVDLHAVGRVLNLRAQHQLSIPPQSGQLKSEQTQKSISRLPLPPNSRSPTWKVTVILSSAWSCSWKHSRECALSWMLWAEARLTR